MAKKDNKVVYSKEQKDLIQFAKEECANYIHGKCLGDNPCNLEENLGCGHFSKNVFPLKAIIQQQKEKGRGR